MSSVGLSSRATAAIRLFGATLLRVWPCLSPPFAGDAAPGAAAPPAAVADRATENAAVDAAAPAGETKAETAEEIEKRAEIEREQALAKARDAVETADQALLDSVPGSVKTVIGFRLFNISLWRYITVAAVMFFALVAWIYFKRRYATRVKNNVPAILGGWHLAMHVARLGLKNPIKLLILGFTLKIVSVLIVTNYHLEAVWVSNMVIYFAFIIYLYDLVGLVDRFYGQWLFHSPDRLLDTVRPLVLKGARTVLLIIAAVHVYQSVTGQTIFSIIAGLGIGGIALALASQETLKNLLGFANIAFDQPFLVGDTVGIGADEGTVEHVGMRSMRIRKYDGTCVVIPNSTAITSNVLNKTRLPFIRRSIGLRLHPNNGHEKVELAISLVREALAEHNGAVEGKPPVVRFEDYEPARLVINAYFWFDQNSGLDYFAEIDRVNREIYRRLSEAGVVFAER